MSAFITSIIAPIIFLNPWILLGLLGLPIIWLLLRITPPAPRLISLPTMRFLEGLTPKRQTPDRTPLWLLLLRLLIIALIIMALARPVYSPSSGVLGSDIGSNTGSGQSPNTLRLIIDNGWESAQNWDALTEEARDILTQAQRDERAIYLIATAPRAQQDRLDDHGLMSAAQALAILEALTPHPWPSEPRAALKIVTAQAGEEGNINSIWLSHGIERPHYSALARTLKSQGALTYITPAPDRPVLLLQAPKKTTKTTKSLSIAVDAPDHFEGKVALSLQALTQDGQILEQQDRLLSAEEFPATILFDLPQALRAQVTSFHIQGQKGAGALFLLDEQATKRKVGLVSLSQTSNEKPFIEAQYYLTRALEPFADLHIGNFEAILKGNPAMIILPDIKAIPPHIQGDLERWIKAGGLLLRFAGENMAQNQDRAVLTPVPLRAASRSLEGTLSWGKPKIVAAFDEQSPFYDIEFHEPVTVRRQILAYTGAETDQKTWARLEDGTPFITGTPWGEGHLVMIHTTASPAWSDLPLSGVYVEILRRLIALSAHNIETGNNNAETDKALPKYTQLAPLWVLDGFGQRRAPAPNARAIPAKAFDETLPSSSYPAGLYGNEHYTRPLNIGAHSPKLRTADVFPSGTIERHYGDSAFERDLQGAFLLGALVLLLLDTLVMMRLNRRFNRPISMAIMLLSLGLVSPSPSIAQDQENYTNGLYLAYMRTGDLGVDATSKKGLETLARVIARRTSVEPDGVVGLTPDQKNLMLFPLIYWPITNNTFNLTPKSLSNVQNYIAHGGTILFDTRDQNYARHFSSAGGERGLGQRQGRVQMTNNARNLAQMIAPLNIPPLEPISKTHVLGKSFYLLDQFPGRYQGGTLWVESASAKGRDNVSSVLIGAHDWASAWAMTRANVSLLDGGLAQQEHAIRFGINLIMYTLTGNYKNDQVHIPQILKRLGE